MKNTAANRERLAELARRIDRAMTGLGPTLEKATGGAPPAELALIADLRESASALVELAADDEP